MSAYDFDAVFEVAAAISCGEVLHGEHGDADRAWGVIDTRFALEAFDAHSDAWVTSTLGEPPRRFTEADAEDCARRLTGSSGCGTVYAAVELPTRPTRATVGPVHAACARPRFACVDWTSGPGDEVYVDHAIPMPDRDCAFERDDSAFGAALAFVRLVGWRGAQQAIARTARRTEAA